MAVFLVLLLITIAGVCIGIHRLSFMKKLAAKIVLVYVMLGWLALCVWTVIFSASELYQNRYDNMKEQRLYQTQRYLEAGSLEQAMSNMYYEKSYEEEFDYAWERGMMYRVYNRYSLFAQAGAVAPIYLREAEKCRQQLLQMCAESTSPENALYVDYYERELKKQWTDETGNDMIVTVLGEKEGKDVSGLNDGDKEITGDEMGGECPQGSALCTGRAAQ